MLKDIFGSLGFVIVGSDILFWAYFFIMDKVSVFESSDFGELRIIVDPKGDVWFVASDVAKSLGYINAKDAVKDMWMMMIPHFCKYLIINGA